MQLSILVDNSQKVDLGPEAKAAPSVSRQDLDQVEVLGLSSCGNGT